MSESTPSNPPPASPPPSSQPAAAGPITYVQAPAEGRKRFGLRTFFHIVFWVLFGLSVLMNLALLAMVGEQLLGERAAMAHVVLDKGNAKQTVAVYRLAGILDNHAVTAFRRFYDEVAEDKNVRAIVLRVDSPGGGVTSSNQIHHMVKELLSAGKTVVVSMGGIAASGGYMVSCSADYIVAEPTTITGSIGVIMTWVVLEGTLDKIGVEPVVIKSTDADYWKDDVSPLRLPDDVQIAYLRGILDQMQAQFVASVRQGRGDSLATASERPAPVTAGLPAPDGEAPVEIDLDANEPLNGKAYLAADAMRLGLIDEIGYRQDAVNRAAALAGLDNPHVVAYRHKPLSLLMVLFGAKRDGAVAESVNLIEDLQTPRFEAKWLAP